MEKQKVKSGDVELDVRCWGDPGSPVVLLLHGFPDTQKGWQHQVDELQVKFRVITFDMRGVGGSSASSRRDAYQMEMLLTDIVAVIDAVVGEFGQVHLVGHDWGAVLGWSFISDPDYSKRILSYTCMSGPHLGLMISWLKESYASWDGRRIRAAIKQSFFSWYVFLLYIPFIPELMYKAWGYTLWQQVLTRNGIDRYDVYLSQERKDIIRTLVNGVNLYRQNPLDFPSAPFSGSIPVPVQIIIPENDIFISGSLFEYYDRYIQNLTSHSIQGKHWAHHSNYKQFNQYITDFVSKVVAEIE